jgi:hypothetical protein
MRIRYKKEITSPHKKPRRKPLAATVLQLFGKVKTNNHEVYQHLQISHCCRKGLMKTGAKNKSSQVAAAQIRHEMLA